MVDTSGLSDSLQQTQIARLQTQRNPTISTDQGTNSTSPYFLGATPTSSAKTINQLSQQWSGTAAVTASIDADTQAKQQQAAALKAAQVAAAAASKLQAQIQSGALAADAANQKRWAALEKAAGQYATSTVFPSTYTGSTGSSNGKPGFMDAQSQGQLATARSYGYNLSSVNYSKSYTYDPTIDAARNKALSMASSYLGTHYVLGGESHSGIDCSGLVQAVYTQLGFRVPTHSAADQGQTGGRNNGNGVPGVKVAWGSSQLKPGDLIAWKSGDHIAIYAGNGRIIEAANTRVGTVERPLWDSPNNVVGIHLNI